MKKNIPISKFFLIIFTELITMSFIIITTIIIRNYNYEMNSIIDIELGTKDLSIENFYKRKVPKNTELVTNMNTIDLNNVGSYQIEIKENDKSKISTLNILDTTPPNVQFQDIIKNMDYIIDPNDFIVSKNDLSNMTVSYEKNIIINEFKTYKINIIVSDKFGNTTSKICNLTISPILSDFHLEKGKKLDLREILFDYDNYKDFINQEDINKINSLDEGTYELQIIVNDKPFTCKIEISDTEPPILELKELTIYYENNIPNYTAFISKQSDASNFTVKMNSKIEKKLGDQTLSFTATDKYGNTINKTTKIHIINDTKGPSINGLSNITVNKKANIDYYKGVSAYDDKDGKVSVSVNTSNVNVNTYGTYYAIYSATDKSGNTTTAKRKIIVNHDAEDTKEKLKNIVNGCSTDYIGLRNCVAKKVSYSYDWAKSDPVWFGLTNKKGNCYVHAMILQELYKMYGITSQLIWVTDESHYWNLVYVNGVWRHTDSTPTSLHNMISSATDSERFAHLQGRNWDRKKWPEAK